MNCAQIIGEYKRVSGLTANPQALQDAHLTPVETLMDAVNLTREILPACFVRFRSRRARALTSLGQQVISYPKQRLNPHNGAGLRLGVILHECAHHIAGLRNQHNEIFVQALDSLVQKYAHLINPVRKVSVQSAALTQAGVKAGLSSAQMRQLDAMLATMGKK